MNAVFILNQSLKSKIQSIRNSVESFTKKCCDTHYMLESGDITATFYVNQTSDGLLYRNLQVSVDHRHGNIFPRDEIVYTLSHYFGFTGTNPDYVGLVNEPGDDWEFTYMKSRNLITVSQLMQFLH